MRRSAVEAIIRLDDRVKAATSQFHNSATAGTVYDPTLGHIFGEMELTVTDVLLVAIISQVHVLVTGPTGRGKTALVELVCQGAFGTDGWHLLRLNPHLNEETFANVDMRRLAEGTLREAISPAPFLSLPCTVLDECNRTPPALTNILLGFCDGRIELKCGLKYEVGHEYKNASGKSRRYHMVIGTMNEGEEYKGTFDVDPALARRFTLLIPFDDLPSTPQDLISIIEGRTGHIENVDYETMIDLLAPTSRAVLEWPLDALAKVYLIYLGNLGRCAHSRSGWKPCRASQDLCVKAECRILKKANAFCPSVGGLSEGLLIFLKRAACGLAALRAARMVSAIKNACEAPSKESHFTEQLRELAGTAASGPELAEAVIDHYLLSVSVTAADLRTMLPFVVLGGKVRMVREYVSKNFDGSMWLAAQHYARESYSWLEDFFRQHHRLFQELALGNGAIEKLNQVLEHAERFNDPYIRQTISPLLQRIRSLARSPNEIADELEVSQPVRQAARSLTTK